jgi:RHS repeat-associated protein
MGIHAQEDASGIWTWAVQDALGNVRLEASSAAAVNSMRNFAPYPTQFGLQGSFTMPFAATGEPTDSNGLVQLRARYLNPTLGAFTALDPVSGFEEKPMSLNGYGYVEGNPVNWRDPSGMCPENPWWNDIPGQRCVWLANELHNKYGWPLDVLMSKDVTELEWAYLWGNANSTFNESSLSQAVRDNPLESAGIIAGSLILAGGLLAGGVVAGAAVLIIGRAILGGVAGSAIGGLAGEGLYQLAVSGQCGCLSRQAAIAMGQEEFVRRASATGAVVGTFNAGALSMGNIPGGYALQVYAGGIDTFQGGQAVVGAGQDVMQNGFTPCNIIQGVLGAAALAGGAGVLNYNRPSQVGNRLLREAGRAATLNSSDYVDVAQFHLFGPGFDVIDRGVNFGQRVMFIDPGTLLRGRLGRLLVVSHELVHAQQYTDTLSRFGGDVPAAISAFSNPSPFQYAVDEIIAESVARARLQGYVGELPIGLLADSERYISSWRP